MLIITSGSQYFNQGQDYKQNHSWSYDEKDATVYLDDDIQQLIELIDAQPEIRMELKNLLGYVVYANYEKADRIDQFLS